MTPGVRENRVDGLYHWLHNMITLQNNGTENLSVNDAAQFNSLTPHSSLTLLQASEANPLCSQAMAGVHSIIIPAILCYGAVMTLTAEQTETYLFLLFGQQDSAAQV